MGQQVSSVNRMREQASDEPSGGLREKLLAVAVHLVREQGHEKLSLREVQRRAGVSSAAAYRHYANRDALLIAVGQRSSALLSDHIAAAIEKADVSSPGGGPTATLATARLRAGVAAYLDFASTEPGLFRTVTMTNEAPERLAEPPEASRGKTNRGPFQLLRERLDELNATSVASRPEPAWSDVAVWAATHGMAILMLDGPLRFLTPSEAKAAVDRLLDLIVAGLAN